MCCTFTCLQLLQIYKGKSEVNIANFVCTAEFTESHRTCKNLQQFNILNIFFNELIAQRN